MKFIIFFISLLFSVIEPKSTENKAFSIITKDSVKIEVIGVSDSTGKILLYKSRFRTPVCEGKICYDVELIFYWNLLGDFVRYELIPGKLLTKEKHIPFSDADYQKLSEILSDKESVFRGLKKEDLVTKINDNNVDAVSGATVTSIKEQTITGAIYSCYTLWHIANGMVADSIKEHTVKMFDKQLVRQIMAMNSQDADYFLINNFTKESFTLFMPEILDLIKRSKGYFAKNCIEKIPDELISDVDVQLFFGYQLDNLDYYAQMALLNRLQGKIISTPLQESLMTNMHSNQWKNNLTISLICSNANKIDDGTLRQLIHKVVNDSLPINELSFDKIITAAKNRKALKADLKMIRNYY